MDFTWSDEQLQLRAAVRAFATTALASYDALDDCWVTGFSRAFASEVAAQGWIGLTWPTRFGGGGRSRIDRLIVAEELLLAGLPVGSFWFADRQIGPSLIEHGTDDQRRRYLPGILSGDAAWCIGMSEPSAGSDLASLATKARRTADSWLIDGQKTWTSFAAHADFCYLICRTGGVGHAGISEIVVPMDTPGVEVRPIRDMAGRGHFCEVFLNDVEVPLDNLIGVEGAAFRQTMRQLEHERGGIDRLLSNYRLYQEALRLADLSDAHLRQDIARIESVYRLGRLLVYREALGRAPTGYSAITKTVCTEHEQRVATFIGQVFGPQAMLCGRVATAVAYAPAYTIMGGTANVLRNIVGDRVLNLPREPSASVDG